MDTPEREFPLGAIRVSDAERDLAVAELSQHYQAGRLTVEEFNDRAGQASEARTGDELHALFTDLPVAAIAPQPPAPVQPSMVVPGRRPSNYRIAFAGFTGFACVANVISGVGYAANGRWDYVPHAVVTAFVFGLICTLLIRAQRRSTRHH